MTVWGDMPYTCELFATARPHESIMYCMCFSADGTKIMTGSKGGTCRLWERDTSYVVTEFEPQDASILSVSLSKEHPIAATGSDDDMVRVFSTSQPNPKANVLEGHRHKVYSVLCTKDGGIVSSSMDGTIRQWDVVKSVCRRTIEAHNNPIFCTCVGPRNPNLVLTAADDATMASFDLRKDNPLVARFVGHARTLWCCDVRFDELEYASCGMDEKIKLWDPRQPLTPLRTLSVHNAAVHWIEYMPDGTAILSAARDSTWRLTSLEGLRPSSGRDSATSPPSLCIVAHRSNVYRALYSPLCDMVASNGTDQTVKLWSLHK